MIIKNNDTKSFMWMLNGKSFEFKPGMEIEVDEAQAKFIAGLVNVEVVGAEEKKPEPETQEVKKNDKRSKSNKK